MIPVRRRYATQIIVSPLIPALKGRAIIRGRYAAQKLSRIRRGRRRSQAGNCKNKKLFLEFFLQK
jgi:hypothetical protein